MASLGEVVYCLGCGHKLVDPLSRKRGYGSYCYPRRPKNGLSEVELKAFLESRGYSLSSVSRGKRKDKVFFSSEENGNITVHYRDCLLVYTPLSAWEKMVPVFTPKEVV